jgi:hypothetical protein
MLVLFIKKKIYGNRFLQKELPIFNDDGKRAYTRDIL